MAGGKTSYNKERLKELLESLSDQLLLDGTRLVKLSDDVWHRLSKTVSLKNVIMRIRFNLQSDMRTSAQG